METNVVRGHMKLRLLTTAIAVAGLAGCSLSEQSAPGLTGPSTLGRSVVLIASPDRILYDGSCAGHDHGHRAQRGRGHRGERGAALGSRRGQIVNGVPTRDAAIPVEPSAAGVDHRRRTARPPRWCARRSLRTSCRRRGDAAGGRDRRSAMTHLSSRLESTPSRAWCHRARAADGQPPRRIACRSRTSRFRRRWPRSSRR